jgi:NAD(P)-dependent dehydrogenase (short-subunit alcohol dehydrogenase family)
MEEIMFKNKIVLVTGGANGIGKAIAEEYLKNNAIVIIGDIDEEQGILIQEKWTSLNKEVLFYKIDFSKSDSILNMMEFIINKYKRLDILINNVGISKFQNPLELSIDVWDYILNVNLRSVFITSREMAKNMKDKGGNIVNIASTRAFMSEEGTLAYSASKGGIVALTHSLAISFSKYNIKVNCISPGWIQNLDYDDLTKEDHIQHPSNRVGKPEDIARACLFLTNDENDFINGENIIIDGGITKKMIYSE